LVDSFDALLVEIIHSPNNGGWKPMHRINAVADRRASVRSRPQSEFSDREQFFELLLSRRLLRRADASHAQICGW